jgi:cell wall-associated NlpC family hydrolase
MRCNPRRAIAVLAMCGLVSSVSSSQQVRKSEGSRTTSRAADGNVLTGQAADTSPTLTSDDGLAVIAAALDASIHRKPKRDCSHLVHAVYVRAGFRYPYASSSDLYLGTREFQRVANPQAGDLVVWRGHVGIVVNPVQHVFFSSLGSGLGIDTYDAPYWKKLGRIRFYRYIKGTEENSPD